MKMLRRILEKSSPSTSQSAPSREASDGYGFVLSDNSQKFKTKVNGMAKDIAAGSPDELGSPCRSSYSHTLNGMPTNIQRPDAMVNNMNSLLSSVDLSSHSTLDSLQNVQALLDKLLLEFKSLLSDRLRVLNENAALCREMSAYHSYAESRGTGTYYSSSRARYDFAKDELHPDQVSMEYSSQSVRAERSAKNDFCSEHLKRIARESPAVAGNSASKFQENWELDHIFSEHRPLEEPLTQLPITATYLPNKEVSLQLSSKSTMSNARSSSKPSSGASRLTAEHRRLPQLHSSASIDTVIENSIEHQETQASKYSSFELKGISGQNRDSVYSSWKSEDGPETFFPFWWNPQSSSFNPCRTVAFDLAYTAGDLHDPLSGQAWVLSPLGIHRLVWDMLAAMFLFCDIWLTPFELLFLSIDRLPSAIELLRWVIVAFFTLEICVNFNTGYIDKNVTITHRIKLVSNYLQHWFVVDLLATIPSPRICDALGIDARSAIPLKALRVLKLWKYTQGRELWMHRLLYTRLIVKVLSFVISIACLIHVNTCILRLLATGRRNALDFSVALRWYMDYYAIAYQAIIGGASLDDLGFEPTTLVRMLDMCFASEHLFLIVGLITYCGVKAQIHLGEDASSEVRKNELLSYLHRRDVSAQTKLQVLFGLRQASRVKATQNRVNMVKQSELPTDLGYSLSQELWARKLCSLGLLAMIHRWNEDFIGELAQRCREDILATYVTVFLEGEASHSAFYILQGEVAALSSVCDALIPEFKESMWFGENSLVNASFRRGFTARARTLCSLLVLPSDDFKEVLMLFGLLDSFEEWCRTELWRGICGRCGSLGDHFSDNCWKINGTGKRSRRSTSNGGGRGSKRSQAIGGSFRQTSSYASRAMKTVACKAHSLFASEEPLSGSMSTSGWKRTIEKDLEQFLRNSSLFFLQEHFVNLEICTLDAVEELDMDFFVERLAAQSPSVILTQRQKNDLSPDKIKAFRRKMQREMQKLFDKQMGGNDQHLVFLSHYKVEAGTEAALMRSELERIIRQDKNSPGHDFDTPIFLDSEDLKNLADLKERVKRSHNIVLLLTNGVLSRPWCLVEIVTAVEIGVKVLLVDVNKKGNEFKFPDRAWFSELRAGSVLDEVEQSVLDSSGVNVADIEFAVHEVFKSIALPYSPHKPESIRKAELVTLLSQCNVRRDKHGTFDLRSQPVRGPTMRSPKAKSSELGIYP